MKTAEVSVTRILKANALFSGATGVVFTGGGWWLGSLLELDRVFVMVMGAGLAVFAAFVVKVSWNPRRESVMLVFAADCAWVIAFVAVVVAFPAALSDAATVVFGTATVIVLGFAVAEGLALREVAAA